MNPSHPQPKIQLSKSADYRETYANSVQVRVSVWDFFLNFGVAHQDAADQVTIENHQGVYVSPQQAKALWNMLGQNLAQYEQAFGAISLEPQGHPMPMPTGPIH
jgi:flagellar protein FlaG